jgi:hypothetical protein
LAAGSTVAGGFALSSARQISGEQILAWREKIDDRFWRIKDLRSWLELALSHAARHFHSYVVA